MTNVTLYLLLINRILVLPMALLYCLFAMELNSSLFYFIFASTSSVDFTVCLLFSSFLCDKHTTRQQFYISGCLITRAPSSFEAIFKCGTQDEININDLFTAFWNSFIEKVFFSSLTIPTKRERVPDWNSLNKTCLFKRRKKEMLYNAFRQYFDEKRNNNNFYRCFLCHEFLILTWWRWVTEENVSFKFNFHHNLVLKATKQNSKDCSLFTVHEGECFYFLSIRLGHPFIRWEVGKCIPKIIFIIGCVVNKFFKFD